MLRAAGCIEDFWAVGHNAEGVLGGSERLVAVTCIEVQTDQRQARRGLIRLFLERRIDQPGHLVGGCAQPQTQPGQRQLRLDIFWILGENRFKPLLSVFRLFVGKIEIGQPGRRREIIGTELQRVLEALARRRHVALAEHGYSTQI